MTIAALDRLEAVVGELQSLDFDTLTDDQVVEVARRVETVRRRLAVVDHAVVHQVEARSLPFAHGVRSAAVFVSNLLRISRAEATARVKAAQALGYRRTVTGDLVEPRFASVAAAQSDGVISERHAAVIARAVDGLPDAVADQYGEFVEKTLLETALVTDPAQLAGHAADLGNLLDQDGQLRDHAYRDRQRRLDVHMRPDGSARLEADLTAEAAAHLLAHLDAHTQPSAPAGAEPDPRSPAQRRHDALLADLLLVERARLLPTTNGITATVILTMDAEAWVTGTGCARTGHGYTIPAPVAKQWAGHDARMILALLSRTKAVAAYSSTHRICTEQQRLALIARDSGCSFPGCDAPPPYCETHHVTEHHHGGPTSLDNLTLLCSFHHRHHHAAGWQCLMRDRRPVWIPPTWLDPDQHPRTNTRYRQ